jgi:ribose/xylose/arabinose/galactoside ABC-type transport system permease subunit
MKTKVAIFFLDNFIWVLLLLLAVIATLSIPSFFTVKNFTNILYNCSSFAFMVLAMTFVLFLGQFDLSIESVYAFGPAIGAMFMLKWFSWNPVLCIVVTLVAGGLVGLFNAVMTVKLKINAFLMTLCMLMILRGVVLYLIPQGLYDIPESYLFLGDYKIPGTNIPIAILLVLLLYILADIVVRRTSYGRNLIATGSNGKAAYLAGINTDKIKMISFVLSGLFAALGGLLAAGRIGSITNGMGDGQIMEVFAAAVLGGISPDGGKGKVIGALGGVIFLQTISNVLTMSGVNPFLIQVIEGALLLKAVVIDNVRLKLYTVIENR